MKSINAFIVLVMLLSSMASCLPGSTAKIQPDANLNVDSLKQFATGHYEMQLKGYGFVNGQPAECDTCKGFVRRIALKENLTFADSTVDASSKTTLANSSGTWTFINDSVVTLIGTGKATFLLIEKANEQLRVVHHDGSLLEEEDSKQLVYKKTMDAEKNEADTTAMKVDFKMLGTEPFWNATLTEGQNPTLRYVPMDGPVEEYAMPFLGFSFNPIGKNSYHSKSRNASLLIVNTKCSDGMSDKVYWYEVTLELGNGTLHGVGEFTDGRRGYVMEEALSESNSLLDGKWHLAFVNDQLWESPKPIEIEINMAEKSYVGNNGCNQIFGDLNYDVKKQSIEIKPGGSTKMACVDYNENSYMQLFIGQHEIQSNLEGTELTLRQNSKRLRFERTR
ncbi:MAG: META domain-containing protein [Flavobacteriales bacterium]